VRRGEMLEVKAKARPKFSPRDPAEPKILASRPWPKLMLRS